jgi:hypothetical protein
VVSRVGPKHFSRFAFGHYGSLVVYDNDSVGRHGSGVQVVENDHDGLDFDKCGVSATYGPGPMTGPVL